MHAAARIISDKFEFNRTKNPQFTMRAFARKVGVSSGALSEIIAGKRNLSKKTALKILKNLDLSAEEQVNYLRSLGEIPIESNDHSLSKQPQNKHTYFQIASDRLELIAEWQHFAILSLMDTEDFVADPKWIASRLRVSEEITMQSLERLVRAGLIARNRDGTLKKIVPKFTTTNDVPSSAIRAAHRSSLYHTLRALDEVDPEKREIGSMTIAFDTSQMEEAKRIIRKFRRDFAKAMERGNKDEVFQMQVSFVPLTMGEV